MFTHYIKLKSSFLFSQHARQSNTYLFMQAHLAVKTYCLVLLILTKGLYKAVLCPSLMRTDSDIKAQMVFNVMYMST